MNNERNNVNVEYKDRLFKLVFREKKDLLELCNAVGGTDYDNPDDLEINTLEDVVYMGMKNDLSFLFQSILSLYEHQSTYNPNLPLRGVFYFADLYRKMLAGTGKDLYASRRIELPFPKFVVFYNGTKELPERHVLHLHDAFPRSISKSVLGRVPGSAVGEVIKGMEPEEAALDCHAVVLNINYGHNRELMRKCRRLEEYSIFIAKVRENLSGGMSIREAIDKAVDDCIKEGILEKILRENREEVCSMLLTEYDEQAHIESEKEIAREEGWEEGRTEGKEEGKKEGARRINALNQRLIQDGRQEDLVKAVGDAEYQNRLLKKYGL